MCLRMTARIIQSSFLPNIYWKMATSGGEEILLHIKNNFRRRIAFESIEIEKARHFHAYDMVNHAVCTDDLIVKIYSTSPDYIWLLKYESFFLFIVLLALSCTYECPPRLTVCRQSFHFDDEAGIRKTSQSLRVFLSF